MGVVRLQPNKVPLVSQIIAIGGSKGGVGKTTIACSLAVKLAQMGLKVGLLDADLAYSNVFSLLGITAKITPMEDGKLLPVEKYGVRTISLTGLCEHEDEAIVWRGPISSKVIQQLIRETVWGQLDILLIDMPSGMPDHAVTILQTLAVDDLIIVTSSQRVAQLDSQRSANAAQIFQVPIIGVIENMRGEIFGEGGGMQLAQKLRVPMLGSIPLKKIIPSLCDRGVPLPTNSEELDLIFTKIARNLVEVKK